MLRATCISLCLVPILAAALGLTLSALEPIELKGILDSLAPDGVATQYDVDRAARIQGRLIPAAIAWLVLGVAGLLLFKIYGRQLRIGTSELLGIRRPMVSRIAAADRLDRVHILIVVALAVFVAALGTSLLGFSMRCDEGAMAKRYALQPWYFIASTYGSPNNHILHTLLVHASVTVFGNEPWSIRLPSLLAGIVLVPVYYWFVRRHFSRSAALLATAFLATSTWIIDQSANARGYTMLFVVFFTILAIIPRLAEPHRWTWFALVVLLTLGFYIVPIMLYPAAITGFWLVFCGLFDVPKPRRLRFFIKIGIVYASTAILTVALYSPAMVTGDFGGVVRDQMEHGYHAAPTSQFSDLSWRVEQFWRSSTHGWPGWFGWLVIAGMLLSVLFSRRVGFFGNRLLVSTILGCASVMVVSGVNPPPWTVGFMLPLVLAFAAAGLLGALNGMQRFAPSGRWLDGGVVLASLLVAVVLGVSGPVGMRADRVPWLVGYPDAKEAATFLVDPVRNGAKIDTGNSTPSSLAYYFDKWNLREQHDPFDWESGETPEEVYFVDTGEGEFGTQVPMYKAKGLTDVQVVKVLPNSRLVRLSRPRAP